VGYMRGEGETSGGGVRFFFFHGRRGLARDLAGCGERVGRYEKGGDS